MITPPYMVNVYQWPALLGLTLVRIRLPLALIIHVSGKSPVEIAFLFQELSMLSTDQLTRLEPATLRVPSLTRPFPSSFPPLPPPPSLYPPPMQPYQILLYTNI